MPNHIQNRLQVKGSPEMIKQVMDFIRGKYEDGKEMRIDFNKIIPKPEQLSISCDGWLSPLENTFGANTVFKQHLDEMRHCLSGDDPKRREKNYDNFLKGVKNYLELGHATWYSWCCENWGTKWNAYDQIDNRNTDDTIYFQTAWKIPLNVILVLSSSFKEAEFILSFASEDSGCYTGIIKISNGEITEECLFQNRSNEAWEIYLELHPQYKDDYALVDGKYKYIGEE